MNQIKAASRCIFFSDGTVTRLQLIDDVAPPIAAAGGAEAFNEVFNIGGHAVQSTSGGAPGLGVDEIEYRRRNEVLHASPTTQKRGASAGRSRWRWRGHQ